MNIAEATRNLELLASRVKNIDFTAPLTMARAELAQATEDAFQHSRTPSGFPWPPFARPPRPPRKLLIKTGALLASARQATQHALVSTTKLVVDVTGLVYYARFHRAGTGRLPRREFLELTPAIKERLRQRCAEQVQRQVRFGE